MLLEDVPSPTTSMLLLEQLRTIDRKRLCGDIERISKGKMLKVDAVLVISINLKPQA
nr:type II toxin-antitoxin system PemK/MazF family toxin [Flavonifractor sp. An306]